MNIDDVGANADTLLWLSSKDGAIGGGSNFIKATDGSSTVFVVKGDGKTGIGTSNPQSKLSVGHDGSSSYNIYSAGAANGIYAAGSNMGGHFYDTGATSRIYLAYGDYGIFSNTGSKNYLSGSLGIGTSSPTGKLDVRGDEVRVWTGTGTNTYATSSGELYVQGDTEVDGRFYNVYAYNNPVAGTYTQMLSSGALGIVSSSRRFKENITDLDFNFSRVLDLRPREFDWNITSDKYHDVGFIAEEVDELGFDKIIDYDEQNRPYAIDYPIITVYLVGLAKEQNKQLNLLEQQTAQLKQENVELKNAVCTLLPKHEICQK